MQCLLVVSVINPWLGITIFVRNNHCSHFFKNLEHKQNCIFYLLYQNTSFFFDLILNLFNHLKKIFFKYMSLLFFFTWILTPVRKNNTPWVIINGFIHHTSRSWIDCYTTFNWIQFFVVCKYVKLSLLSFV